MQFWSYSRSDWTWDCLPWLGRWGVWGVGGGGGEADWGRGNTDWAGLGPPRLSRPVPFSLVLCGDGVGWSCGLGGGRGAQCGCLEIWGALGTGSSSSSRMKGLHVNPSLSLYRFFLAFRLSCICMISDSRDPLLLVVMDPLLSSSSSTGKLVRLSTLPTAPVSMCPYTDFS